MGDSFYRSKDAGWNHPHTLWRNTYSEILDPPLINSVTVLMKNIYCWNIHNYWKPPICS